MATATIGSLALYGWAVESVALVRWFPGIEQMAPNTALCFVLAGMALSLPEPSAPGRRNGRTILGSLVVALSCLVLIQYFLDFRVFTAPLQLFLNTGPENLAPRLFAGKMAVNTAMALFPLGLALFLVNRVRTVLTAVLVSLLVFSTFFIALLDIAGHLIGAEFIFWHLTPARMSPYTAAGLVILSAGLLSLNYRRNIAQGVAVTDDQKIAILSGSAFLFVIVFTSFVVLVVVGRQVEEELRAGLAGSLNHHAAAFQDALKVAVADVESIAKSRPLLRKRMEKLFLGVATAEDRREIQEVLDNVAANTHASAVTLYDSRGKVVGARGRFVANPEIAVNLALQHPAKLLWDGGGYFLNLAVPMLEQGRRIGTLAMEMPLPALARMFENHEGLGQTGEMFVCAPLAGDRMRCFPSRHQPQGAMLSRIQDGCRLPMARALAGAYGVVRAIDYRKQKVIAAHAPIGALGLGMVIKKDEAEVAQPLYRSLLKIAPTLVALVLVGIAVMRWWVQPLVRDVTNMRDRIQAILDNVAEGIVAFGPNGLILESNPAAARIFGYADGELEGRDVQAILPAGCQERCGVCPGECAVLQKFVSTAAMPCEVEGRRKDGASFPLELLVSRGMLDGRRAFIALVEDITGRKQAERVLRESEERFRATFEQTAVGIVHLAPDGGVLRANRKLCETLGYSQEELSRLTFLDVMHPENVSVSKESFQRLLSGQVATYVAERRCVRKDGTTVWCQGTVSLVRDRNGAPDYVIVVLEDISERRQLGSELREAHMRLLRLTTHTESVREEERARIAREIHDELGQQLTALKMDISWLRNRIETAPSTLAGKLDAMSGTVDTTIGVVRRIATDLRPAVLDLGLAAAIEWQAQEFEARTGITCRFEADGGNFYLYGPRATAVFRIVQESLTNVARHAQATAVAITLVRAGESTTLEIRDNGRGIAAADLHKHGHFGLLGIRERVLMMGGKMEINGQPGEGTVLRVRIPVSGGGSPWMTHGGVDAENSDRR